MSINKIYQRDNANKQSGYSLIQMAIALLVMGIIATAFLQIYTLYEKTQKMIVTQDNVNTVSDRIQSYRQALGTYPCPAPMNVQRSDVNYGSATAYATYLATPAGTCTNGICIENNTRTINGTPTTIRVRVGAVPFRDMQLDEKVSFDGYGSRLWYAVTEDMCNLSTFDDTKGGIAIVNNLGESQIEPAASAAFIIVSPGENKVGGYSKFGNLQNACASSGDTQNCRDLSVATQTDATTTYLAMYEQDGTTATTFDDIVQYFAAAFNPLWRRETPTSENITNMTTQNVGIGTNSPTSILTVPQTTVDSSTGNLLTTNDTSGESGALRSNGQIQADTYCDSTDTTKCFQPKDITGNPDTGTGGTKCAAGYAVGITSDGTNAQLDCANDIGVFCPPGKVLTGFTGNPREPVCSSSVYLASCPAMTITDPKDQTGTGCGGSISLPASSSGVSVGKSYGACVGVYYKCNNGSWAISGGPWGRCVNTAWTASGQACGQGYTGTYTFSGMVCGGPTTSNWATACPPTCIPYSTNSTTACVSPQTGPGITTTTNYVCDPGGATHSIASSSTTGSCTCGLQSKNIYQQCSSGYVRSATPSTPTTSDTPSTNSWPADTSYGKVGFQNVDTGTCTTIGPTSYTDNCVCDTSDQYSASLAAVPTCKVAKSGSRVVNGTSYDYKYDVVKATVSPATCTAGAGTVVDAAQFDDAAYKWVQQAGAPLEEVAAKSASYPDANDSCSCSSQAGNYSSCYVANTNGKYYVYNCKCQ